MAIILHIATKTGWNEAQLLGAYRPDNLDAENFTHCSRPEQLIEVANLLFRGRNDLVLLVIDREKVTAQIKEEDPGDLQPTGKRYPHIYGALNLDAVIGVKEFKPNSGGTFDLPAGLAGNK